MSIINTQLNTATAVAAGGLIPVGNVIHKCGAGMNTGGSYIRLVGSGYVKVTVNATVEPTAAADMTMSLYENGTAIASATAMPAAAGGPVNLTLVGLVYNRCGCNVDAISVGLNTAGTVTEMDIVAEGV